jgi:uncharacterized membrane protein
MAVSKTEINADCTKKSSTGMDAKVAVLLAYLFSWLGGLIIWLIEKENKFVKWNALQALILGICQFIIIILFFWILTPIFVWAFWPLSMVFTAIGWICLVVLFVVAIICIVQGFQCKTFRTPGISSLTDKYFKM